MEGFRKITIVILVGALFFCEAMFMGIFAVDAGASSHSVKDALDTSGLVSELTNETLKANTVNMGGRYGEEMEAVMDSDAMTDFFTAYISNGIRGIVYGQEQEEIGADELVSALSSGIDEVNSEGQYTITADEKALFLTAMSQAAPDLTASLNETMQRYELTTAGNADETAEQAENSVSIASVMKPTVRIVLLIMIVGILLILAMLSRKDGKFGGRSAGPTAVATIVYLYLGFRGIDGSETIDMFLSQLVKDGAMTVAIGGAIATVILIIVGFVLRRRTSD